MFSIPLDTLSKMLFFGGMEVGAEHFTDLFVTQLTSSDHSLCPNGRLFSSLLVLLSWVTAFLRPSLLLQWVCVGAALLSEANNPQIWLQGLLTNKAALQVTSKYLLSRVAFPRRLVSASAATIPKCLQLHWENLLIELQRVSDGPNRQRKFLLDLPFYLLYLHSVAEVNISADVFCSCSQQGISKSVIHFWLSNASEQRCDILIKKKQAAVLKVSGNPAHSDDFSFYTRSKLSEGVLLWLSFYLWLYILLGLQIVFANNISNYN